MMEPDIFCIWWNKLQSKVINSLISPEPKLGFPILSVLSTVIKHIHCKFHILWRYKEGMHARQIKLIAVTSH